MEIYMVLSWSGDGVVHVFRWPDEAAMWLEERGTDAVNWCVLKTMAVEVDKASLRA